MKHVKEISKHPAYGDVAPPTISPWWLIVLSILWPFGKRKEP